MGRVHAGKRALRARTPRASSSSPCPDDDDCRHGGDRYYGDRAKMAMAFADLLNQEARALQADGVDVIQFDEPAFNVFLEDVNRWGIAALERAAAG